MIVKICGIKDEASGEACLEAGAAMLGFNFYRPSPRYVEPEACARLVAALRAGDRAFKAIGVFVNEPPAAVAEIMERCGLDCAQLSGDESPRDFAGAGFPLFKAIRPSGESELARGLRDWLPLAPREPSLPEILVDACKAGSYGGSGALGDWGLASRAAGFASAMGTARPLRLLLAGGLKPANASGAARVAGVWGLDVASGVESAPGAKDAGLVRAFIESARSAI
jgi:phosphoribosylanthranilate isomerase